MTWLVAIALMTASIPLVRAWTRTERTALRPAVIWAGAAIGLGLLSQVVASVEPIDSGRVGAGHLAYLTTLATLAATITVLNARKPGGGAWALLMGMLVLVFLVPWLEGLGLARGARASDRLRLDAPWSYFYVILVVAGVTNFLPTRFGLAAILLLFGFVAEFLALSGRDWRPSTRSSAWSAMPASIAAAAWAAWWADRAGPSGRPGLERAWLWFRDHWGVVWGLRVLERFNKAAEAADLPVRLSWHGVVSAEKEAAIPHDAESIFIGLTRRFAEPARMAEESAGGAASGCGPEPGAG